MRIQCQLREIEECCGEHSRLRQKEEHWIHAHGAAILGDPPGSLMVQFDGGMIGIYSAEAADLLEEPVQQWCREHRFWITGMATCADSPEILSRILATETFTHLPWWDLSHSNLTADSLDQLASEAQPKGLILNGTTITDSMLKGLDDLATLRRLDLASSEVHGSGLRHLEPLPALQILSLSDIQANGLKRLGRLTSLRDLEIDNEMITLEPEAFRPLCKLQGLERLTLTVTQLTSEIARYLVPLHNLKELDLGQCNTTAKALARIGSLTDLEKLTIYISSKSPGWARLFRSLTKLRKLSLASWNLDRGQLQHLAALPSLEHLDLEAGSPLSETLFEQLSKIKQLQRLSLTEAHIPQNGFRCLQRLSNLQALDLRRARIDDSGIQDIANLSRLQWLAIEGTAITAAGKRALESLRPDLTIESDPGSEQQ